jgi:hypothetical protein
MTSAALMSRDGAAGDEQFFARRLLGQFVEFRPGPAGCSTCIRLSACGETLNMRPTRGRRRSKSTSSVLSPRLAVMMARLQEVMVLPSAAVVLTTSTLRQTLRPASESIRLRMPAKASATWLKRSFRLAMASSSRAGDRHVRDQAQHLEAEIHLEILGAGDVVLQRVGEQGHRPRRRGTEEEGDEQDAAALRGLIGMGGGVACLTTLMEAVFSSAERRASSMRFNTPR